jgi:hypothetical protein
MKYLGVYFNNRLNFHKHIVQITEKSRKMTYMLGKTAKSNWGLEHKSLRSLYEGAVVRLMTYGAPVWQEAVKKQRLLGMIQSTQRLINIKIAKVHRTISFEASCLMAGVQPIGLVIEGKIWPYKKNSTGKGDYEGNTPLPAKEWSHPAWRADIMETTGEAIQIQTTKSLFKQSSRTDCNSEVPGTITFYRRPNQQKCDNIYRQCSDPDFLEK